MIPTRSVLDISDLLADPILRGLAGDAAAARAMQGKPAGFDPVDHSHCITCDCMDDQAPECDTCGGSGVIASCGPCPECQV